jgi:hypothetical protein
MIEETLTTKGLARQSRKSRADSECVIVATALCFWLSRSYLIWDDS